jgi:hypothetical protein
MIDDRIKAKMKQLKLASGDTTTTDSATATTATSNDTATAGTTSGVQQSPAKALSLGLKGGKGTMTMLSGIGLQSRLMQPTAVSVSSISGVTVGANGRLTSSATKDINEVNISRHIFQQHIPLTAMRCCRC